MLVFLYHILVWISIITTGISVPEGCDGNVDLAFALDSSESILDTYENLFYSWNLQKDFIKTVVQLLPTGSITKVSTLRFSSNTELVFDFQTYANSINIQDAIVQMDFLGGNTNLGQVFQTAKDNVFQSSRGSRSLSRKILVVLTDGLSNINGDTLIANANSLKQLGIEIYTVSSTQEIDEDNLMAIASSPPENYHLQASHVSQLNDLANVLVHRICGLPDPAGTTTPMSNCMDNCAVCNGDTCEKCVSTMYFDGVECVSCMFDCDVCTSATECKQCNVGWYWDPTTLKCEVCEVQADLTILMDNSGSIRLKNPVDKSYDNYDLLKNFVKNLLGRLEIHPDATRVAILRFSTQAILEVTLDQFTTLDQINKEIDDLPYENGHTNTAMGLRLMREMIYKTDRGDRPNVRNIAIVITDGESTNDHNLTIPEATLAKEDNITLFVVGVTNDINEDELTGIASDPDEEHYFNSTEIRHLDKILNRLTKYVCAPRNPSFDRLKRDIYQDNSQKPENNLADHSKPISKGENNVIINNFKDATQTRTFH